MAHIGKRHQAANGGKDFRYHPVGGVEILRADVFPNLVKVKTGFRVKIVPGHEPGCERRAEALFSRR